MEDLIKCFDFLKDFVEPAGLTLIVIVGLISYYFSNKKNQKDLLKTTSSIDTSIDVLSNSILTMDHSNKELVLSLMSSNNDLAKMIVTGVSDSLVAIKKKQQKEHDESLQVSIENADRIKNELYNILLVTHSDLVALTQLHNGGTNLNNVPFVKYDITNQTNSTNSAPIFGQLNSHPASEYSLIYKKVLESSNNVFWGNINEIEDDYDNSISHRLAKICKQSLICIGLFNESNTLYAFINIFFNDKRLTKEFVRDININRYKYKIENILNDEK
jgi:dsDNA-binding SOS-regulon protein